MLQLLLMLRLLAGCGDGFPKDDLDGDGYPRPEDCDDDNRLVHLNAVERCNGFDDDCDGYVDDPTSEDAVGWCATRPHPTPRPTEGHPRSP